MTAPDPSGSTDSAAANPAESTATSPADSARAGRTGFTAPESTEPSGAGTAGTTDRSGSGDGAALRNRAENLLTWLGGASADITDRHERASYAVTGAVVLLFAVVCGVVAGLAGTAARWPAPVMLLAAVLVVLLAGAVGRALATAPLPTTREGSRTRWGGQTIGRIAVAALAGIVVAELASTVLLGGTVNSRLDDSARGDAESAAAVVTARTAFDQALTDRKVLGQTITGAQADIDQALIIARCEYNPTPSCPQDKITGVPGRGPETQTDNSMLDDARTRLAAAQARVQPLDDRAAKNQQALDQARTSAFRTGDRGLGARWVALNDYTLVHPGALLLRLATIVIAVTLALLPLLLRRWRGETAFDRRISARAAADRAEQQAAATIAVRHAEVRAETEILRAEQELAAAHLAVHADTVIDRERQRRRIVAEIGGVEIGVTAPQRRAVAEFEALAELPAANPAGQSQEGTVSTSSNLPAPRTSSALEPAKKGGGLELPIIGTVPFTDTAARWIRPLVPSFVTDALDTATHPLRTVRQVFEETEEITFTLRRTHKVTVDSTELGGQSHEFPGSTVIDAEKPDFPQHSALTSSPEEHTLSSTGGHDALTGRRVPRGLEGSSHNQLPPAPGQQ